MSKKRRSLKHRAELYASRWPANGVIVGRTHGVDQTARTVTSKAWRDGYLQALRDVRKHNPWAPEYVTEIIQEVMKG